MKVEIITTANFRREAKRLLKKHPSLKDDLIATRQQLLLNPSLGIPLGYNCYKIRLAIKSKGRGKSRGARIITHLVVSVEEEQIFLLSIYDKSEFETITDKDLRRLIKELKKEK